MKFLILLFSILFPVYSCQAIDLNNLSIEEKVGQMMMAFFLGEDLNEDAIRLIDEIHIGGIIYYRWANGLKNPLQVQNLSNQLQQRALSSKKQIPLFIATDQEGGLVQRLTTGFTQFPGNAACVKTGNIFCVAQAAYAMGIELNAVGINMNLAPVVDVDTNKESPVIGIRAFSNHPKTVAKCGNLAIKGFQLAGVIPVLKHFPGYGEAALDPHLGLPIVDKPLHTLNQCELFPFKQLHRQAEAIMTAHIVLPALDTTCATLSQKIIAGLLRKEWGYDGIIMTDSLVMEGLLESCDNNIDEAALQAILSGHDILLFGGKKLGQKGQEITMDDLARIQAFIVNAVASGRISVSRIDQSVKRILQTKEKYNLHKTTFKEKAIENYVKTQSHEQLAKQIAAQSVKVVSKTTAFNLASMQVSMIVPAVLDEEIERTPFFKGLGIDKFIINSNPTSDEIESACKRIKKGDLIIFFAYDAWRNKNQQKLFNLIREKCNNIVVFVTREPIDNMFFDAAQAVITTYSPTSVSLQAGCEKLFKNKNL